jgi:hypothetical protein
VEFAKLFTHEEACALRDRAHLCADAYDPTCGAEWRFAYRNLGFALDNLAYMLKRKQDGR